MRLADDCKIETLDLMDVVNAVQQILTPFSRAVSNGTLSTMGGGNSLKSPLRQASSQFFLVKQSRP